LKTDLRENFIRETLYKLSDKQLKAERRRKHRFTEFIEKFRVATLIFSNF
jgi:hypothetical protein